MTLREQLSGAGEAVRQRDVLGSIVIGMVIFMLIFGLFLTALPVYLERDFGLGAGQRGLVIAAPAITSTIAALRLGWLRARVGVVRLLCGASVLFTIAFVGIGLAPTIPLLLVGTLLYGFGEGVFIPTLQDVVAGVGLDRPAGGRGGGVGGRGARRPDHRPPPRVGCLRRGRHLGHVRPGRCGRRRARCLRGGRSLRWSGPCARVIGN